MEENLDLVTIQDDTSTIISDANLMHVETQEEYNNAVEYTKNIKKVASEVKAYWKKPKETAAKAHKEICAKEKEMLLPLETAEKILKQKMINYVTEQEKIRKEQERQLREAQEKLAYEELQRAEELRKQGNEIEATAVEENAITISEMETKIEKVQKGQGISYQKDYEITVIDSKQVPSYVNGIEIRKIDLTAIKKIVKITGNTIEIPGIEIKETKIMKVRN